MTDSRMGRRGGGKHRILNLEKEELQSDKGVAQLDALGALRTKPSIKH